MTPGAYNFGVYPGADIALTFAVTDFDLTGFTGAAKMRAQWDSRIAFPLTVAIANSGGWTISVTAPGSETAGITRQPGAAADAKAPYFWDLELTDGAGAVIRFLQGRVSVFPDAT